MHTETDKMSIPDESSNRLALQAIKAAHLENSENELFQKKEDPDELQFYDMAFSIEKDQAKAQSALKLNNHWPNPLYNRQYNLWESRHCSLL